MEQRTRAHKERERKEYEEKSNSGTPDCKEQERQANQRKSRWQTAKTGSEEVACVAAAHRTRGLYTHGTSLLARAPLKHRERENFTPKQAEPPVSM